MKSKLKRAVSLLVALAMSLSLMSVGAFAADFEYVEVEKTAVLEAELFIEDDGSIFAALPEDAPEGAEAVAWHSSDETVALIDGDGVITLVGEGETDITVTVKYLETVAVPVKEEAKEETKPEAEAEEQDEAEAETETAANDAAEEAAPGETAEPAESGEGESAIEIPDDYSTLKADVEELFKEEPEPAQTADESPAPVSEESAPVVEEAAAQEPASEETVSAQESAAEEQPSEEPIVVEATSVQNAARPLKASAVGNTLTVTSLTAANDDAWKSTLLQNNDVVIVTFTDEYYGQVTETLTVTSSSHSCSFDNAELKDAEYDNGDNVIGKTIAYLLYCAYVFEDTYGNKLNTGTESLNRVVLNSQLIFGEGEEDWTNASIFLDQSTLSLFIGLDGKTPYQSETLTATKSPASATVTWTSSDTSVATVSGGRVTPKGEGSATIRATISKDDVTKSATCTVTVEKKDFATLYPVYVEYTAKSGRSAASKSGLASLYANYFNEISLITLNTNSSEVVKIYGGSNLAPNQTFTMRIKEGCEWSGYFYNSATSNYAEDAYRTTRELVKTENGYKYYTYRLSVRPAEQSEAVARVGDTYYKTVYSAVLDAMSETEGDAKTVVLLDSDKLGSGFTVNATTSTNLKTFLGYSADHACYVTIDATQMTGSTALNIVSHGYVTLNATGKTLGDVTVNNSGAASSFLTVNGGAYGKLTIGGGYETKAIVNTATFNGDVLVKGTHSNSSGSWRCYGRLYVNDGAVFNGTVTLDNGGAPAVYHDAAHPGALIVTGGTFNGNVDIQFDPNEPYAGYDTSAGKTLSAKGALDESTHTGGLVNITGGTFVSDVGAWVADGYVQSASGAVVVGDAPESLTLSQSALSLNLIDARGATLTVDGAGDLKVFWTSSNPEVATVDNGVVAAVAPGTATITVSAGGKTASCEVTVAGSATVKFVSDGTVLSSRAYPIGTAAESITAPTPTKAPVVTTTAVTTYIFKGWNKTIEDVTADATYTAVFEEATTSVTPTTTTNGDGSTTTTVTTENGSVETTVKDNGDKTVVETSTVDGVTTTVTTEAKKEAADTSNALRINTAKETSSKTTTIAASGEDTSSTATVEETTKTVGSEGVTVNGTGTTKYTFTVTTTTKTGESAEAAASSGTTIDSSSTVVAVEPKASTAAKVDSGLASETGTAADAAKTAAENAGNVIGTESLNAAKLGEKLAALAEENAVAGKDVTVDVALTLDTTLTGYTGDEGDTKATTLTYEVKPYLTTTVKVGDDTVEEPVSEPVANADLAGTGIIIKLPLPNSFASYVGQKISVKHTSDGYADEVLEADVRSTEDNYYAEFTVTHFSSFQIIDPISKVIVTFDSAGGSNVDAQTIDKGATATQPSNPTRSGYTFGGWTLGGGAYSFATAVDGNITLVATWTQNRTETPVYYGGGGGGFTAPAQQQEIVEIDDGATPLAALPSVIASVTVNGETYILSDVELPYADVAANSWFRDAAAYMTVTGIMNGTDKGFSPDAATSGSMAAAMLYRMATGESTSGATWADAPLAWVEENALTEGIGFTAGETATREQLVTMLYRLAEAQGYDVSAEDALAEYPDAEGLSEFADKAMRWAVAVGIINGMDGKLNAGGSVTRAQIATMMMRFCELTDAFV